MRRSWRLDNPDHRPKPSEKPKPSPKPTPHSIGPFRLAVKRKDDDTLLGYVSSCTLNHAQYQYKNTTTDALVVYIDAKPDQVSQINLRPQVGFDSFQRRALLTHLTFRIQISQISPSWASSRVVTT